MDNPEDQERLKNMLEIRKFVAKWHMPDNHKECIDPNPGPIDITATPKTAWIWN